MHREKKTMGDHELPAAHARRMGLEYSGVSDGASMRPRHLPVELSVRSLQGFYARVLESAQTVPLEEAARPIGVGGDRGWPSRGEDPIHCRVPLTEEDQSVLHNLSKADIRANGSSGAGDVRVVGRIIPDVVQGNRIDLRIELADARQLPAAADRVQTRGLERDALEQVKSQRRATAAFPAKDRISITVISACGTRTFAAFTEPLRDAQADIACVDVAYSASDISKAIQDAQGSDVLALMRGGGSPEQLRVFDSPEVVEAMAGHQGYRVVGLGHAHRSHLVDLLADYVGSTPAGAGAHVRLQLNSRTRIVAAARHSSNSHAQRRADHIHQMASLEVEFERIVTRYRAWLIRTAAALLGCVAFVAWQMWT